MPNTTKKVIGAALRKDGVEFRVWAPFAAKVEVTGSFNNWSRIAMENEGGGYWAVFVKKAIAGQEYKFVITNGEKELVKNDPRSLQLITSAGNSVIVDPSYEWGNGQFVPPSINRQVIYEMHIGTFNRSDPSTVGTFENAQLKLDYLAEMGINMIEVMPVNSMAMDRGWGYASDYIYAVESLYGGRRAFLEFIKAAHQRGMGVILDVVYNHFGPDNNLDLWQFDGWGQDGKGGIYFYNDWRSSTPWGETRPDYGRPEVRDYIFDNARMWLKDFHLDGLRLDSTIYLRNVKGHNDDPGNDLADGWSLMQQITNLARKINPAAITIAEDISGNNFITRPVKDGGAGFNAQWEVTFPMVLRGALDAVDDSNRNVQNVINELTRHYNGDVFQRIIYSDSHDSAANGGARLSEEIAPGNPTNIYARRRSLMAAALVLTSPGIPMLFQGQEFMEGGSFNDWQALDWEKAKQFSGMVLAIKHLIDLRKNQHGNTNGLTGQSIAIKHFDDNNKVLAYHRWEFGGHGDDVMVIINFKNKAWPKYEINFPSDGLWRVRFNSDWKGYNPDFKDTPAADVQVNGSVGGLALGPYSVLVLSQDK